jgi:putative NADH-flavin reductase
MKVIIFGATGMVGQGVLRESLLDDEISSLLTVGRTTTGITSPKLLEIQHSDLLDYGPIEGRLAGFDACFFCLGISSAGMKEADYERRTYGITFAAAQTLSRINPDMVFTYVSGPGTDSLASTTA